MNTEKIKASSEGIGEPTWFTDLRKEAGVLGGSRDISYGLGVSPKQVAAAEYVETTHSVAYSTDTDTASLHTWSECFGNDGYMSAIKSTLSTTKNLFENPRIADAFAAITGGVLLEVSNDLDGVDSILLTSRSTEVVSDIVIVIVRAGISKKIILENYSSSTQRGRVVIVVAEEGSHVQIVNKVEDIHTTSLRVIATGSRARVEWKDVCIGERGGTFVTRGSASGVESSIDIRGAILSYGESEYDLLVKIDHSASYTESSIGVYGALFGNSKIIYRGDLGIESGASGVSAEQYGTFEMFSKNARVDAIPSLDIASKDVMCRHGVSIGAVSGDALVYPSLRGISVEDAVSMRIAGKIRQVAGDIEGIDEVVDSMVSHTYGK